MQLINRSARVVNTGARISKAGFTAVLTAAKSPAANEAGTCYDAILTELVDPLFALAVFSHESGFGLLGINAKYGTRNAGNTRTSRTGKGELIQTERGQFVKYANFTDGFQDLARRLADKNFAYAQTGAVTIETIMPIFAPPTDGNDVEGYILALLIFMNKYQEASSEVTNKPMSDFPLIDTSHWAKLPNYEIGGNSKQMIVIHDSEGGFAGSRDWLCRQLTQAEINNDGYSSAHYIVSEDGTQIAQMMNDDDVGYHAGNAAYNHKAIGIEHAGFQAGQYAPEMLRTGARLTARLCKMYGIPADRQHIIAHGEVPPPNSHTDPGPHWNWNLFMQYVAEELTVLNGPITPAVVTPLPPAPTPAPTSVYINGHLIGGGFYQKFNTPAAGIPVYGLPISDEYDENGETYQDFERARFEYDPAQADPAYRVQGWLLGVEWRKLKDAPPAVVQVDRPETLQALADARAEIIRINGVNDDLVGKYQANILANYNGGKTAGDIVGFMEMLDRLFNAPWGLSDTQKINAAKRIIKDARSGVDFLTYKEREVIGY